MTRTEENAKTIKNLEKTMNGEYSFEQAVVITLGSIVSMLIDISKSLAVIADKAEDNT